jgi:hypothetical protein
MSRFLLAWLSCSALLAIDAPAPVASLAPADAAALVACVKELGEALNRADAGPVIKRTHPALIQLAGSRQKFEEAVRASFKSIAGYRIESYVVGAPAAPVRAGDQELVVVPVVMEMRIEKNRLRSDGFMLGARAVGTTEWFCLDGAGFAKNPELLAKLFPGLPAGFKLPASKVEILK